MPAGLQVFDESANLVLDLTTRASRIVGVLPLAGNAAGSVFVDPTQGTPWGIPVPTSYPTAGGHKITINAATGEIAYAPNSGNASFQNPSNLYYGVY